MCGRVGCPCSCLTENHVSLDERRDRHDDVSSETGRCRLFRDWGVSHKRVQRSRAPYSHYKTAIHSSIALARWELELCSEVESAASDRREQIVNDDGCTLSGAVRVTCDDDGQFCEGAHRALEGGRR